MFHCPEVPAKRCALIIVCENSDLSHLPLLLHPSIRHAVSDKAIRAKKHLEHICINILPAGFCLFFLQKEVYFSIKRQKTPAKHQIRPVSRARSSSREGTTSISHPTPLQYCYSHRGGKGWLISGRHCCAGDTETHPPSSASGQRKRVAPGQSQRNTIRSWHAPGFIMNANGLGKSSQGLAVKSLQGLLSSCSV